MKTPFILKPAIGFFSMGVYKITSESDLELAKEDIQKNIRDVQKLYPKDVIDGTRFIIEECIAGEEYAIDAYFDSEGEPVILDILKHDFSSEADVSDRAYYTSKEIIEEYLDKFTKLLITINEKTNLKNFPFHIEVKVNRDRITPIEINPLRFAGWCTTDIAYYAYGVNVYKYYLENQKPDWNKILEGKEGKLYSMIILDRPQHLAVEEIKEFNYDRVLNSFAKPLELRKIDHREYPVFGFVFTETEQENKREIEDILKSDLLEYIELR
ncbi:ATP-grasp domain-containing protein [Desulfonispora thiosulfatigenes]|nr:ATP-grasp domain-containing protein [Desulfonispora thiosulfatigenes]